VGTTSAHYKNVLRLPVQRSVATQQKAEEKKTEQNKTKTQQLGIKRVLLCRRETDQVREIERGGVWQKERDCVHALHYDGVNWRCIKQNGH